MIVVLYFSHFAIKAAMRLVSWLLYVYLWLKSVSRFDSKNTLRNIVLSFYLIGFMLCGYGMIFLCCAQIGVPLVYLTITFYFNVFFHCIYSLIHRSLISNLFRKRHLVLPTAAMLC